MIKVKNLGFSYNNKHNVLNDISFSLNAKDILCLLGPNGTGKTTLLKCILKLIKFQKGEVYICGKNISDLSTKERAKLVAYVPQAYNMSFPYEVREVVVMGRTAHISNGKGLSNNDLDMVDEALKMLGISHLKYREFNKISGGERQMVLIARAIVQEAKVIIMDEPTANLDYGNQVKMLKVIKTLAKKGYGILMTSHFPNHAFLVCNRVALLKDGLIMDLGSPNEVVTSESLTKLYGTEICVTTTSVNNKENNEKVCIPIIE